MTTSFTDSYVHRINNASQTQEAKQSLKNTVLDTKVQFATAAVITGLFALALTGVALGLAPSSHGMSLFALVPAAILFAASWDSHKFYRIAEHTVDHLTDKPVNLESFAALGQSILNSLGQTQENLRRNVQQEVDGTILFRRLV